MRQVEFARPGTLLAPRLLEIAVAVELVDAGLRLAVALQHIDVAGRAHHRFVRLVEKLEMTIRVPFAGLAFDAKHHLEPSGRIELVDEVCGDVGRPDIVLRIDAQAVRPVEQPIAKATDEIAVGVELHQRLRPAMNDEHRALGRKGDARGAAEIHAGRQLEGFRDGDVRESWC